ncbi:2OG-Fe dioxygenase family protein [Pseudomonas japonica]|uniref:2OG-Fe dioxygenase n=1 Tax=Pseudomonas japonica TaxID=256466 RepID=A0A239DTU4_9PSED|nr:2OG-Fe dioxygenase family protein [Pseudomonas japonica]SNS35004.1 2OG-Fe dioxygenase [Pseudomonas japonica]
MIIQDLMDQGFARFKEDIECDSIEREIIEAEFNCLEHDEYAPDAVKRFRRYANGVILPWRNEAFVEWLPAGKNESGYPISGYDQGGHNPEHTAARHFRSLSERVKSTRFLQTLITADFSKTFWSDKDVRLPIYVGVHFVRLVSTAVSDLGISSPNCFHQDGEPFTFAHLVRRAGNTAGGVNYICAPWAREKLPDMISERDLISRFELAGFMDSFAVHDPRVSHYVTPIHKAEETGADGERCILLIDFSTMRQNL